VFTNSLDYIRVASPCPADWNEMFGDERKRFCSECKLNVYNLSGMKRREAEELVFNLEGRLCVSFFKRADGTVITADCPVGWALLKRRVSKAATAAASIHLGFIGGVLSARAPEGVLSLLPIHNIEVVPISLISELEEITPVTPELEPTNFWGREC
jgi:hypothetical protein